ncbi:glycoside hydrolase family 26 protein [Candidatus Methylacidithermus pantelleriae]|uniref:Beta-mannanase n=1 Tax=Candidatus Methylacidithermus pantelleriae TaxID=2744239 RepID=A0A8J2BIS1_9BACT|nr:glycosyl hydrolase [Candidatus Methylacidithermus pantelleriae]CAF0694723.1 Beta-mannanase [Candidatus Methylacidithermus pantelleriae]
MKRLAGILGIVLIGGVYSLVSAAQVPALIPPPQGAYTGAYIDFGETEDHVTLESILGFEELVGKHQAIVAFANYWGENRFPKESLQIIYAYGAIPLVYWSPWGPPYEQNGPPGRCDLRRILHGQWDAYIDHWAQEARALGKPLLVAWGIEMNGTWFPWSGWFYGRGKPFPGKPGAYRGPETYKAAYRYVVDRVRSQGAWNIQWVFHVNNYSYPDHVDWNAFAAYYPGSSYVDWLGMSAYGKQFPDEPWITVPDAFDYPYDQLCSLDPAKPVIFAEWGVGEFPKAGSKARWISEAMERMSWKYPRLKAAIFWHERWENEDGTYSNLKVNSSEEALEAYRKGVSSPFWISWPIVSDSPGFVRPSMHAQRNVTVP